MNDSSSTDPLVGFAKILSDSTRQNIMAVCCCRWVTVGEIVDAVNVSQPTVSHHLAILKAAGLVKARHRGKHTYYTLLQDRVVSCCGEILEVFAPESDVTLRVREWMADDNSEEA